ncbi:hypothetical protein OF829_00890 [Sphingomonas sp. LB-2]|uniref:hypothetical protein n=1 Tax=Sphingomonas caeni TaxID=2984949 RepID=UPI00222FACA9|nr:hypothetical protein [Sphingomonas caeni]MCW3845777.1 hypothetical protein [Sphingomonas caeni]
MKTRSSALYKRTENYHRRGTSWIGAVAALAFAAAPLVAMLWVVPVTGIGIA